MTRPRHPRNDKNQNETVAALQQLGFVVFVVSSLPVSKAGGDLFVLGWHAGQCRPVLLAVELKPPGERLTPSEAKLRDKLIQQFGEEKLPFITAYGYEDVVNWFERKV